MAFRRSTLREEFPEKKTNWIKRLNSISVVILVLGVMGMIKTRNMIKEEEIIGYYISLFFVICSLIIEVILTISQRKQGKSWMEILLRNEK